MISKDEGRRTIFRYYGGHSCYEGHRADGVPSQSPWGMAQQFRVWDFGWEKIFWGSSRKLIWTEVRG